MDADGDAKLFAPFPPGVGSGLFLVFLHPRESPWSHFISCFPMHDSAVSHASTCSVLHNNTGNGFCFLFYIASWYTDSNCFFFSLTVVVTVSAGLDNSRTCTQNHTHYSNIVSAVICPGSFSSRHRKPAFVTSKEIHPHPDFCSETFGPYVYTVYVSVKSR